MTKHDFFFLFIFYKVWANWCLSTGTFLPQDNEDLVYALSIISSSKKRKVNLINAQTALWIMFEQHLKKGLQEPWNKHHEVWVYFSLEAVSVQNAAMIVAFHDTQHKNNQISCCICLNQPII